MVPAHDLRTPRSSGPRAPLAGVDVVRRGVSERPRVEQSGWLFRKRQSLPLDDLIEVAIVAQDELTAIADNHGVLRLSIAALLGALRPEMAISEKVVDDFLLLDLTACEREEMLARASRLVMAARPAINEDRLARALEGAVEELTIKAGN